MSDLSLQRTAPKKNFKFIPKDEKLPLVMGANFHDDPICRSSLHRSNTLNLPSAIEYTPHASYHYSKFMVDKSVLASKKTSSGTTKLPSEVVLRLTGYCVETIPESPDETTRVRRLGISYHLDDGTMMIREHATPNAGMSQGVVVKRQQIPKSADPGCDEALTIRDLNIGNVVQVFGFKVHIVDMDASTRNYCTEKLGMAVPEVGLAIPDDPYTVRVKRGLAHKAKKEISSADMEWRRQVESATSNSVSKHSPEDISAAKQYFANAIMEHLQFGAIWDDRDKRAGDLRHVVINYFTENDTIEVVENRPHNAGREGGLKLLCRQRVQKPGVPLTGATQHDTYGYKLKSGFVSFNDLDVDMTLRIHNRDYYIYDASTYTRDWYRAKLDKELKPRVDISAVEAKGCVVLPKQYPPPHDGFGSEEDSLQNWRNLMLKPLKVDREKQRREEGKVMSFAASLTGDVRPEDEGRQFVVNFFRSTDEVEVIERQLRNTGIVGGKFLTKGRYRRPNEIGVMEYYKPSDFEVGKDVQIQKHRFLLTAMDERSKKILEGFETPVTEQRLCELIVMLKDLLNVRYTRIQEGYRALAPEGKLTKRQIADFFDHCNIKLTDEEASQITLHFAGESGVITFDKFLNLMEIGSSANMDVSSNSIRAVRATLKDSSHTRRVDEDSKIAEYEVLRKRLKKIILDKVECKRANAHEVYRQMAGSAPNSKLSQSEFILSLNHLFHMAPNKKELDAMLRMLFPLNQDEITYVQFCEFLENDQPLTKFD